MKLHLLNPATTGHSSLLTSATSWMDARNLRIQRQRVEREIVLQVQINAVNVRHHIALIYVLFLVLACPEKDVTCIPSCDASGVRSLDNVTSTRQCASKLGVLG